MRLRKIWAEGSFSVLKREHCLSKVRKRGIPAVTEECLLSVMALNLKRMVKAILFTSYMLKIRVENINFQPGFLFVNRSLILPYLHLSICETYSTLSGILYAFAFLDIKQPSCRSFDYLNSTTEGCFSLFVSLQTIQRRPA